LANTSTLKHCLMLPYLGLTNPMLSHHPIRTTHEGQSTL
jgi:hypothetical protein